MLLSFAYRLWLSQGKRLIWKCSMVCLGVVRFCERSAVLNKYQTQTLPCVHVSPSHPGVHVQVNSSPSLVQVPSFSQGLGSHGSTAQRKIKRKSFECFSFHTTFHNGA